MKRCFKCGCEKPLSEFYAHKAMADGRLNKCKTCTKSDVKAHRSDNIEKLREYDRERSTLPHRRALNRRVSAGWAAANPQGRAAQIAVGNAVRSGKLERWPCEICGKKAHAHHPDYSMPLVVTWLCPPHHKEAHAVTQTEPEHA